MGIPTLAILSRSSLYLENNMRRVLKNSLLFFDAPQADILSAGFLIMFLSVITGIFGLVRDRLLATHFTPDLVGVYFAAFVIPENIFQILVLSAVGAAFIPVFTKYQREGQQWEFATALFRISLLLFATISILVGIFIEPLSKVFVPGIQKETPGHIALFVNLTRLILFSQLFFLFSYFCTGILQSYQRFLMPALASSLYNLGIIVGILLLAPTFGMYGVVLGIIGGAFLHLLIQLPFAVKLGFSYRPHVPLFHPGIAELGKLMAPRVLSVAIERLKFTVDTALASLIFVSSITFLNYASHVAIYPVSLFAAAIGQAALPFLAKAANEGNMEDFKKHTMLSLTHIAFFLAPTSVLLIILHTPIVRLIFGTPKFDWEATFLTGMTLAFLALGLFAQGASTILARAFYALLDTKTPLVMTIISQVTTILLSVFFVIVLKLPVWSLGLSTTIGISINAFLLFVLLDKKVGRFPRFSLFKSLAKIFFISALLAIFSYTLFKVLERFFNTDYGLPLLIFTITIALASGAFYLFLSFIFNLEEYKAIFLFFKKAASVRQRVFGR